MSNSIHRDQQRRTAFAQLEEKRLEYKCAIRDLSMPAAHRALYVHRLNNLQRKSSLIRVRNRCVWSGRSRGVYRFSRLCRIKIRELAGQGMLLGVCKSSW